MLGKSRKKKKEELINKKKLATKNRQIETFHEMKTPTQRGHGRADEHGKKMKERKKKK